MKKILRPQKGPQEQFLASSADIGIYGGAAGGGKTFGLLLSCLRYKDVPGFGAVILRRNHKQIFSEGGLWDEATEMYSDIPGAKKRLGSAQWAFADKNNRIRSKVTFSHIFNDGELGKWQGSQICGLCCEENTPVLMADGSEKPLHEIRTGDMVMTLNGAAEVTAIGKRRYVECVELVTEDGNRQVQTTDHKFLTKRGWISYDDIIHLQQDSSCLTLESNGCCSASRFWKSEQSTDHTHEMPSHKNSPGQMQDDGLSQRGLDHQHRTDPCEHIWCELHRPLISAPMGCCFEQECERHFQLTSQAHERLHDSRLNHQRRAHEDAAPIQGHPTLTETFSYKGKQVQGNYYESYPCYIQAHERLISGHPSPVHGQQSPASTEDTSAPAPWNDELPYVRSGKELEGSPGCCSTCSNPCDEPGHREEGSSQAVVLLQGGVVVHSPTCSHKCDEDKTHTHSRCHVRYRHPYSDEELTSEAVCVDYQTLKLTPIGKRYVIDITVDVYNHYITQSGIVNKNCFDELTHFTEKMFFYMLSRNRSTCGVRPYVKATCNPDADSWVAKFISWWIDQDTGYPIPERSGVVRWMVRLDNHIYWADTAEELYEQFPDVKDLRPKSVTFVMSSVYDNRALMENDPGYVANLLALTQVEQERLLRGNWKIRAAAGLYFKRTQIGNYLEVIPDDVVRWVRCWDLAATAEAEGGEPAYTAGVLMGKRKDGRYVIADVINVRQSAGDVRKTILLTAQKDKARFKRVTVRLPQDPGQAGKDQAQSYIKLLSGFNVKAVLESGSKEARAEPMAAQWQAGNFDLVHAPWNDDYVVQLENFPDGKFKDMVDASANAFAEIESGSNFSIRNLL